MKSQDKTNKPMTDYHLMRKILRYGRSIFSAPGTNKKKFKE